MGVLRRPVWMTRVGTKGETGGPLWVILEGNCGIIEEATMSLEAHYE